MWVKFTGVFGHFETGVDRIKGYMECAAKRGSDFIIFPEMALTGYDDEPDKPLKEKMQYRLAETIPGPTTKEIEKLAKDLGIYAVMGMPARDGQNSDVIYNALAVFHRRASPGPITKCICLPRNRIGRQGEINRLFWKPPGARSDARFVTIHTVSRN